MLTKQAVLNTVLLVLVALFPLYGQQVLVMPGANSTNNVTQAYSPDASFAAGSSFSGSPGAFIALSNPTGTQYYLLSNSGGTGHIDVFSSTGSLLETIGLASPVSAGEVSPDGKRLLVLANQLSIFDITGLLPLQLGVLDVGLPVYDLAVSLDSKRAFVTTSTAVVGVDLTSYPPAVLANKLPLTNYVLPVRIAAGPNGLIYVTVPEELWEIDGGSATGSDMVKLNSFQYGTGVQLAKPAFSPDGRYLVAGNGAGMLPSMARLDLPNHTTLLSVAAPFPQPTAFVAPSSTRFYGFSTMTTGPLYDILMNNFNLAPWAMFDGQVLPGVKSAAVSNEIPNAGTLYVGSSSDVSQIDLTTGRIKASQPTGGIVAYLAPASTAAAATLMQYSGPNIAVQTGADTIPFVIRALDSNGRPVFNDPVTWTAPGLTAQATMAATNAQGFAQAVFEKVPTGTYTVTATVGSQSVSFRLVSTTGGGTSGTSGGLSITAGAGQVTTRGNAVNLAVRLTDASGNPKANAEILWAINQPSGGTGTLIAAGSCNPSTSTSTMSCTTDEEGNSRISFRPDSLTGSAHAQFAINAQAGEDFVTFIETAVPDSAYLTVTISGLTTIRGRAGQTLAKAIKAQVLSPAGPMADIGIRVETDSNTVTASCAGPGGIALTDASGNAVCDLVLGGGVGSASLTVFAGDQPFSGYTLTVDPGQAASVTEAGGNNQSGNSGQNLPLALKALITDAGGHPVPGATSTWTVISGTATLYQTNSTADYNGHVSTGVTLGSFPGPVKIQVQSGTGSFMFTATVNGSGIVNLVKIDGDNQTALVGAQFATPLSVQVTGDSTVGPIPGVAVSFAVTSGAATLSAPALTDASGKTSVVVTAGQTAGPVQITATVGNQTQTFNLTARIPGPVLHAASFVNGASFARVSDGSKSGITHGSIVSIIGDGLTQGLPAGMCISGSTVAGALPTRLAGIEVEFGGLLSPIYHVCRTNDGKDQVTIQVPFPLGVPSTTSALVRTDADTGAPKTTTVEGIELLPAAPGIFEWAPANSGNVAVAIRPDGSFVSPTNPARKGETIRLYTTGLGVSANPPTQTNVPGMPGQTLFQTPTVQVGGQGASGVTAEYAQNVIGIWIVTFQVPATPTVDQNGLADLAVTVVDGPKAFASKTSRIPIAQ